MSDDQTVADTKLAQYLNEAYVKERELESALQAHIAMTSRAPYKKRLQQHLKETKSHARQVERRIKAISGSGPGKVEQIAGQAVGKGKSLAKAPLHMVRGTSDAEKMLKNAKSEYWNEHEEIATYSAIETLAEAVGDKDTAKVARGIRREEERMASFLERQIPTLTKAVARDEIPAKERRTNGRSRRRSSSRAGSSRRSSTKRSRGSSNGRRTTSGRRARARS
jgi:ferritin-like metal-binding protein YciE